MSFYNHYTGRSVGRILHFIYYICGLRYAEQVCVSEDKLTYYDKPFAECTWDDNNVPTFKFIGEYSDEFNKHQQMLKDDVTLWKHICGGK